MYETTMPTQPTAQDTATVLSGKWYKAHPPLRQSKIWPDFNQRMTATLRRIDKDKLLAAKTESSDEYKKYIADSVIGITDILGELWSEGYIETLFAEQQILRSALLTAIRDGSAMPKPSCALMVKEFAGLIDTLLGLLLTAQFGGDHDALANYEYLTKAMDEFRYETKMPRVDGEKYDNAFGNLSFADMLEETT